MIKILTSIKNFFTKLFGTGESNTVDSSMKPGVPPPIPLSIEVTLHQGSASFVVDGTSDFTMKLLKGITSTGVAGQNGQEYKYHWHVTQGKQKFDFATALPLSMNIGA